MTIFEDIKNDLLLQSLEWAELPEAQMPTLTYRGDNKIVYIVNTGGGVKVIVSSETFSVDYEYYGDLNDHSHVIAQVSHFLDREVIHANIH